MRKITNKKIQSTLLKGAVTVSGGMATLFASLFCDSIYGVAVTIFIGATAVVLAEDTIK